MNALHVVATLIRLLILESIDGRFKFIAIIKQLDFDAYFLIEGKTFINYYVHYISHQFSFSFWEKSFEKMNKISLLILEATTRS